LGESIKNRNMQSMQSMQSVQSDRIAQKHLNEIINSELNNL